MPQFLTFVVSITDCCIKDFKDFSPETHDLCAAEPVLRPELKLKRTASAVTALAPADRAFPSDKAPERSGRAQHLLR